MQHPWDDLPGGSIWDGWEKQTFGVWESADGVCAEGFLRARLRTMRNVSEIDEFAHRVHAVHRWLARHYGVHPGISALIYANDALHWTPEMFRNLDRKLEWEYRQAQLAEYWQAQLAKQIDAIPAVGEAGFSACCVLGL
jgi:hypothetical protein